VKKHVVVREGERVIRRLQVFTESERIDLDTFIARAKSDSELVEMLSKYPIVLIEEYPEAYYTVEVMSVNSTKYTGSPLEIRGERGVEVSVQGFVESDYYPYPVEIELLAENTETNRRSVIDRVEVSGLKGSGKLQFTVKGRIADPGEYIIVLKAKGRDPKQYSPPEKPVAKVVVTGEVCVEKIIVGSELEKALAEPMGKSIVEFKLSGTVKKYMVERLIKLFQAQGFREAAVSGTITAVTRENGRVRVEASRTAGLSVSQLITVLGNIGELESVNLSIEGVSVEKLKSSPMYRSIVDSETGLASIVSVKLRECRRIA